jgi:hypothetical protein
VKALVFGVDSAKQHDTGAIKAAFDFRDAS